MLGVVGQQCCVRLPGALRLPSNCAHWIRRTTKCHCSLPKEMQKEHLSSAPMSAESTLTKEPLQMPPFHMTVTTAILGTLSNRRRRPHDGSRKRDISLEMSLRMYNTL